MINCNELNREGGDDAIDTVERSLEAFAEIPEDMKNAVYQIINQRKEGLITERECRFRIFIALADLPLGVLVRVLKGE